MPEYQERLVSTRTKKVIEHSPTGAYILNTHALHNYHQVLSVLSLDIHKQLTAAIVANHNSLLLYAATLLRAAKVTEGEPTSTGSAVDTSEKTAPAFVKVVANGNRKAPMTTKEKRKGKGKPSEGAPKNAAVSTSANHTTVASMSNLGAVQTSNPIGVTAASISDHGASSALPVPGFHVLASSNNAALGALPLPASFIQGYGQVVSSVVHPQAYSIPVYLAPAQYYGHSAPSAPSSLPANSMFSPPTHYYYLTPPHSSVPGYYMTLQAPHNQGGYYWVGP